MKRTYGLVIALFMLHAQAGIAGELKPKVLVTTPPLKPYMDAILRGVTSSESLLRPGQDAHTFTLSPSQRKALAGADVIIIPDRQMSPALDRMLTLEEKRGAKVVELTGFRQAKALPYPAHNHWLAMAGEHADTHRATGNLDPHVWLDPERMAALAVPVAAAVAEKAPSLRASLNQNAQELRFHLREEVMPGIEAIFANLPENTRMSSRPQVPFITYHAAYQYFLKRFGLEEMGEITQRPEDYLGARTLHGTVAGAGKVSIRCIISETNSPLVQRIAKASGAQVVALSPEAIYRTDEVQVAPWVRNDYDRLLLKTAQTFAGCL